jgi:hypothetical protein
MRRSASEVIRSLEMRIARLEKQSNSSIVLKDIDVKIKTEWDLRIPGGRRSTASHVYYDGKLKSWASLSKNLDDILKDTRVFQSEKEYFPESSYQYPKKIQSKDEWASVLIPLENVNGSYLDTRVFVALKHNGQTLSSDNHFRIWSDFHKAVQVALNRIK